VAENREEQEWAEKAQAAASETAELEALLDAPEGETEPAPAAPRKVGVRWGWVAGGGLLMALMVLADQFFFSPALDPEPVSQEAPVVKEQPAEPKAEPASAPAGRVYSLEPFFVPLTENGRETGRYIRMTPSFLVSDDFKDKEMDVSLSLIRKNIYNILTRKEAADYRGDTNLIKETIKQEIIASANASLRKGSGSINDIYYEQFLIK
jgi:flagellar basal body-associated protein FliL